MKNTKLIAACLSGAIAGPVYAGNTDAFVEHINIVSTRTRAEVLAELEAARAREPLYMRAEFVDPPQAGAGNMVEKEKETIKTSK